MRRFRRKTGSDRSPLSPGPEGAYGEGAGILAHGARDRQATIVVVQGIE